MTRARPLIGLLGALGATIPVSATLGTAVIFQWESDQPVTPVAFLVNLGAITVLIAGAYVALLLVGLAAWRAIPTVVRQDWRLVIALGFALPFAVLTVLFAFGPAGPAAAISNPVLLSVSGLVGLGGSVIAFVGWSSAR